MKEGGVSLRSHWEPEEAEHPLPLTPIPTRVSTGATQKSEAEALGGASPHNTIQERSVGSVILRGRRSVTSTNRQGWLTLNTSV